MKIDFLLKSRLMIDFKLKKQLNNQILSKLKVNGKSHIIAGFLG